ncbi:MAG: hypothetical protein Q8P49_01090 [Candidatus Liptonbacteria bacterium]|nr:hypothetical protein [Candidatus Liptonbacteria bacterium]
MKLETIEDFRRVAKALLDPRSTPQQYAIVNPEKHGYCTVCNSVTEYNHDGYKFEWTTTCSRCYRRFGTGMTDRPSSGYIRELSEMPAFAVRELTEIGVIPSREEQKKIFVGRLKSFIDTQDSRNKQAKKESREAAKTAAGATKILAQFA